MIQKVTIYGERCSGTNYLEQLLITNFNVKIVWTYGRKHFFGFSDLSNSDDVLFIGIIRNIIDWVNSLYRERHHLPSHLFKSIDTYLTSEFYSFYSLKELMEDRNLETNERYKNIFELRHIKNKFLVETMPTLVKNYLLITYDNLVSDFDHIMNKIKDYNLPIKTNIEFPLNVTYYKNDKKKVYTKKENAISDELIIKKANLYYEKILFPTINFSI